MMPIAILSFVGLFLFALSIPPEVPTVSESEQVVIESIKIDTNCVTNCSTDFIPLEQEIPSSNDSTLTQILDQIEISSFKIEVNRIIGQTESKVSELDLSKSLAFIVDNNNSNVDLTLHDLSYSFVINQKKIEFGSALVETLVNGNFVFEKRYDLKAISETGIVKIYTEKRSIGSLLKSAPDGPVKIELKIKEFYVRDDQTLYSLLKPVVIHTLTLQKDSNQILYQDENGKIMKVYPTDDLLQIQSRPSNIVFGGTSCIGSTQGSCTTWFIPIVSFTPKPPMGEITVYDELGNVVAKSIKYGGGGAIDRERNGAYLQDKVYPATLISETLQRNSTYVIKIGEPNNIQFTINTPKSQQNYVYFCTAIGCNFP